MEKYRLPTTNTPKEWQFIYKGIFIIIALLFLVQNTTAASLNNNLIAYYTFDDTNISGTSVFDVTGQDRNGTNSGAETGQPGILGESFEYLTTDVVDIVSDTQLQLLTGGTFNMWVNFSGVTSGSRLISKDDGGGGAGNDGYSLWFDPTGDVLQFYIDGLSSAVTTIDVNTTGWQMVTVIMEDAPSISSIFVDGVNATASGTAVNIDSSADTLDIGNRVGTDRPFGDNIDELGIWNISLNTSDIIDLYNGGVGLPFYLFRAFTNFTIKGITDDFNGNSINIFNITMDNGTLHEFNTTVGEINTNISGNATSLFNITFQSVGYLNNTWLDYNISTNIESFSAFFNMSRHNITAYTAPFNLTQINNFTITSSEGGSESTTNGSMIFPISWNTSIVLTFNGDEGNFSHPTYTSLGKTNNPINFSVFQTQSFYLRIFDEITNLLINNTGYEVIVELISDDFGQNYSFTNGTLLVPLIVPDDYIIKYDANYTFQREYFTNLSEGGSSSIDLYLLNDTYPNLASATGVDIEIRDSVNDELEGAILNVNKYFSASNSYITVERLSANFEGATKSYLTTDEFYRFVVEYQDEVVLSTSPTKIFDVALTFIVNLIGDPTVEFKRFEDISTDLSYINATKKFTLTYADSNSLTSEMCLQVYQNLFTGDALIGESCSSSQSGTILLGIIPEAGATYTAKAVGITSSGNILLDLLTVSFKGGEAFDFGNNGLLIVLVLTLVFIFMGIFNPVVMLLLAPLPLLVGSIVGFVNIPIGVAIAVYAAFVTVVIIIGRRA